MANLILVGYKSVGRSPDTYFTGTKPSDLFAVPRIVHVKPYSDPIDADVKAILTYDEGAPIGPRQYYIAATQAQVLTAAG